MNKYREILRKLHADEPLDKSEKISITKLGEERIAKYAEAYDALSVVFKTRGERREVRDKVAEALGIDVRTLNAIIKPEFKRPERMRDIANQYLDTTDYKIDVLKAALSVIASGEPVEYAAIRANCSARTVYRRVRDLLKPLHMDLRFLEQQSVAIRSGMANDIEQTHMPALIKERDERLESANTELEIRAKTKTKAA